MKHTHRQTTTRTLTDLGRAIERQHAVTITYLDRNGEQTVRTIEPYEIRTAKDGRLGVRALCRLRGNGRTFHVDRIVSYTVHRIGFVLERPEPVTVDGHTVPLRSAAQLIARELGRDDFPRYRHTGKEAA